MSDFSHEIQLLDRLRIIGNYWKKGERNRICCEEVSLTWRCFFVFLNFRIIVKGSSFNYSLMEDVNLFVFLYVEYMKDTMNTCKRMI